MFSFDVDYDNGNDDDDVMMTVAVVIRRMREYSNIDH